MPLRGRGREKAPTSNSEASKGSRWWEMQSELSNMMWGIVKSLGIGNTNGTKGDPWLKKLSRLHASAFNGRGKPKECEAWLLKIEKILESMECPEEKWVRLASFLFEGVADQWWRATRRLKFLNSDLLLISWGDFWDFTRCGGSSCPL